MSVFRRAADPRDRNICPLCFERVEPDTRFLRYCPACPDPHGVEITGENWRELSEPCGEKRCHSSDSFHDLPFLAHAGCRWHNPLIENLGSGADNKVRAFNESGQLDWLDIWAGNKSRSVSHWSLPIVRAAAEKVPGVQSMWFPSALYRAITSGDGRRVQLVGSTSVGKSVLASVVVNPLTYLGLGRPVQVENYAYASPYPGDEPFAFYAKVIFYLSQLRGHQPLRMSGTLHNAYAVIRAAFIRGLLDGGRRALVLYDLAGEHFEHGGVHASVTEQARNSDCLWVLVDITRLKVFQPFLRCRVPDPGELTAFHQTLTYSLLIPEGDRVPRIVVVTKLDLVDVDATGTTEFEKKALDGLAMLKSNMKAASGTVVDHADLEASARENLELLRTFFDPSNEIENVHMKELERKSSFVREAFFVWTEGLGDNPDSASAQQTADAQSATAATIEPSVATTSYGVVELVAYTLGV
jgi:hypothetical protein